MTSQQFPCTCPVCGAIGVIYPDHQFPVLMTRGEWNCGTHGKRLNTGKHEARLWLTSRCYWRYVELKQANDRKAA